MVSSSITQAKTISSSFSWLPHCDVSPILVGENAPVILFDFTPKGLNISNDPDLLSTYP